MYPVSLILEGRSCLVVGGGGVALRKIHGLLKEAALVTVVSPDVVPAVEQLADERRVVLHRRAYQSNEATGYALVFAATDDREVNRQVFDDARATNTWVNVADDPELCTFHLPARVTRGALQIAVGSGGRAPFVTRRLRQFLETRIGDEWGEWIEAAARFRETVRDIPLSREDRERLFDTFFENTMDRERFTVRVPGDKEAVRWCPTGSVPPPPPRRLEKAIISTKLTGFVSLVGAGPGDPGLIAVKGRERLMKADAVVCDRLAIPALPCDLPARVELHFVGKEAGNHPVPQGEINALLVRLAKEGKRVVRLKGGDPYIYGRGGEEVTELAQAGVPFEVVPCVTAAVAVPAYAGIPVTYRKEVVRVTLVTAHEAIKSGGPQVRWDLLAQDPHAMILGYMGVTRLPKVAGYLLEAGMDPLTPAALIERGTTTMQRTVISTLKDLNHDVRKARLNPPALFVIGPTIRHAGMLDWFGKRPLIGERLAMFNPDADFVDQMQLCGAEVIPLTSPVTPAARMVMDSLPITGAIFTTKEDVEMMADERDRKSWVKNATAWCLTAEAAERARAQEWIDVQVIDAASDEAAEALISAMIAR
jgi:uroporphyrin-III C-methyltransferase / precorrin-2 dehydrogenase / sirohydrochlorin ferrochelatase